MTEHHLEVTKTARYFALGQVSPATLRVMFVLHGFTQNAKDFLKVFESFADDNTVIIAPEGLNRFYLKGPGGEVGVTWMTKEDRLNEIKDYVSYLDKLYTALNISPTIEVVALGFSQGASTVTRWVDATIHKVDKCIVFAGEVGNELLPIRQQSGLNRSKNYIIYGNADDVIPPFLINQKLIEWQSLDANVIEFTGGHAINKEALIKALG